MWSNRTGWAKVLHVDVNKWEVRNIQRRLFPESKNDFIANNLIADMNLYGNSFPRNSFP